MGAKTLNLKKIRQALESLSAADVPPASAASSTSSTMPPPPLDPAPLSSSSSSASPPAPALAAPDSAPAPAPDPAPAAPNPAPPPLPAVPKLRALDSDGAAELAPLADEPVPPASESSPGALVPPASTEHHDLEYKSRLPRIKMHQPIAPHFIVAKDSSHMNPGDGIQFEINKRHPTLAWLNINPVTGELTGTPDRMLLPSGAPVMVVARYPSGTIKIVQFTFRMAQSAASSEDLEHAKKVLSKEHLQECLRAVCERHGVQLIERDLHFVDTSDDGDVYSCLHISKKERLPDGSGWHQAYEKLDTNEQPRIVEAVCEWLEGNSARPG